MGWPRSPSCSSYLTPKHALPKVLFPAPVGPIRRSPGASILFNASITEYEYYARPTDKEKKRKIPGEEYNEADKRLFTRHQPTSYANPEEGYTPPYFGHNKDRAELLVGMSFDPNDCQLNSRGTHQQ